MPTCAPPGPDTPHSSVSRNVHAHTQTHVCTPTQTHTHVHEHTKQHTPKYIRVYANTHTPQTHACVLHHNTRMCICTRPNMCPPTCTHTLAPSSGPLSPLEGTGGLPASDSFAETDACVRLRVYTHTHTPSWPVGLGARMTHRRGRPSVLEVFPAAAPFQTSTGMSVARPPRPHTLTSESKRTRKPPVSSRPHAPTHCPEPHFLSLAVAPSGWLCQGRAWPGDPGTQGPRDPGPDAPGGRGLCWHRGRGGRCARSADEWLVEGPEDV